MDSVKKRDSMSFTTQSFIKGLNVNLKKVDLSLLDQKLFFFFQILKELELWGGDFYADEFESILVNIGQSLKRLVHRLH